MRNRKLKDSEYNDQKKNEKKSKKTPQATNHYTKLKIEKHEPTKNQW